MSERQFEPLSDYEARLGHRLMAVSEPAVWPIDALAVARGAVQGSERTAPWTSLRRITRPSLALILLILALAALIGSAIFVGSRLLLNDGDRLGHLAYTLDDNLWISDWDGSNPVLVAVDVAYGPKWSIDGSTLSYFVGRSEDLGFYQVAGDGQSIPIEIDRTADDGASAYGVVSPSGEYRAGTRSELPVGVLFPLRHYLTIIDGAGKSIDIPPPPGYVRWLHWESPVWSPDSESIFVATCTTHDCRGGSGSTYKVPRNGGVPIRLTPEGMRAWPVAVSPTGSSVAFFIIGPPNPSLTSFDLGVVQADGSDLRVLTTFTDYSSSVWAPDGQSVAVTGLRDGQRGVWMVDVAGSHEPRLLEGTTQATGALDFSPDGRWLLTGWDTGGATSGLWRVEVDGTIRDELVQGAIEGDWQRLSSGATE